MVSLRILENRKGRAGLWLVALASVSILLPGCGESHVEKVAAAAPPAPVAAPATAKPAEFVASGPLVVENQLDIQSLRDGVLAAIDAEVGKKVRKGDLLAQLDDRQIVADRDAAQAKVKSSEADVQGWVYETRVLQSDLNRDEALAKANLMTPEELDHARYKVEADKYETERSQQNLINAQDTLKSLNLEVEKTRIVAPFDGVIARRYVRAGQKISVGDRLFWITATEPLYLRFTLPQRFAGRVAPGQQVALEITDFASAAQARVVDVSPVVDPASGTIEVAAELVNPSSNLRPGMTATLHLPDPQ